MSIILILFHQPIKIGSGIRVLTGRFQFFRLRNFLPVQIFYPSDRTSRDKQKTRYNLPPKVPLERIGYIEVFAHIDEFYQIDKKFGGKNLEDEKFAS